MNHFKQFISFLIILSAVLLWGCGYQPLLNKENQKFTISKFYLEGNKRLGGLLKNNLISVKKADRAFDLTIKSNKKTSIANKSLSGKVLNYSLTLDIEISASENNNVIFSKVFTKTQDFSASDVHSDTLNNEKKLVDTLIESIASELQIALNSIGQK